MKFESVPVKYLHKRIGFPFPIDYPLSSQPKPLTDWKMEVDDSPIFRYIYRNFKPKRHLEFGTWQGTGVLYCLEECDATVWTINILQGEETPDGNWAFSSKLAEGDMPPVWSKTQEFGPDNIWFQTDSLGFIGRYYLQAGMGHRVCQIFCDSQQWDISNYPIGFFDTVLIDGGHTEKILLSDTDKALQLVRPGGIIMWHDFCPDHEVQSRCQSAIDVTSAIKTNWDKLCTQMTDLFWIYPSWILLGIKR
jgi:hypothetical protein